MRGGQGAHILHSPNHDPPLSAHGGAISPRAAGERDGPIVIAAWTTGVIVVLPTAGVSQQRVVSVPQCSPEKKKTKKTVFVRCRSGQEDGLQNYSSNSVMRSNISLG